MNTPLNELAVYVWLGIFIICFVTMHLELRKIKSNQVNPEDYGWTAKSPGNLRKVFYKGDCYLYYTYEKTWVVQHKNEYFNSWTIGEQLTDDTMQEIEQWIEDNKEDV